MPKLTLIAKIDMEFDDPITEKDIEYYKAALAMKIALDLELNQPRKDNRHRYMFTDVSIMKEQRCD